MGKDNSLDSLRERIKNSTKNRSGLTVWKAPQSTSTEQTSTQQTDPIRDRIMNSTKKSDTTKLKVSDSLGTFDIGPKLVYAPEDQKAASQSTPLNLQYKLLGIGGELDRGEREVQQAVDRFNADKSEENRQAVENLLATYQTNLDAYKSTVDEYNHYYSLDGYKERAEAQDKEVKALTEERDKLKMYLDGVQSGTWVPDQAFLDRVSGGKPLDEALEEVQGRLDTALSKSNAESKSYVLEESEDMVQRLNQNAEALQLYRSIQPSGAPDAAARRMLNILDNGGKPEDNPADLAKIKQQLGISPESSGGTAQYMNDLRDALNSVELEQEALREKFASMGFDYDQLQWYELYKEQEKSYSDNVEKWEAFAKEHPIVASAASVFASPAQGLDFLDQVLRGAGHSDPGNLDTFRPASVGGMPVTTFVNTVRGTVSKELEEKYDWELWGQNVASFLYNTGMSMADSYTQIALMGPAATVFMGGAAAASTAQSVIERGGSNRQAFSAGLAAGVAEAFFEKVSIEHFLTHRDPASVRDYISRAFTQGGVEASEEMLTEVSNIISDALILGELSENKGKSLAELIAQVGWAGAGGFLSGGSMVAVDTAVQVLPRVAIQQVQVWAHDNMTGRQLKQASVNFSMVEQALSYAEDSETYRMASDMAQRLNASTTEGADSILRAVTDAEYGRLARSMTAELETKGPAGVQNQVEAAQAARPEEKVASPTMQAFLEAGDTAADAEVKAGVLDRILSGDTTLTNTQLRKLKLNTQAGRTVFEKLTGVPVPKSADTKTLIATARSAAEQAVMRKTAAVDTAARQEATAHAKGAPVSTDSAAAAWRSAQSSEQSQESFMAQLEREAEMAAQEVEAKAAPTAEPASAFMPRDGVGSGASFVAQLEQEAAETAQQAEAKAAPTASEPAAAFAPKTAAAPAAQQSKGKTRSVKGTLSSLVKEVDARAHTMETADGQKVTYQKFWDAYTAQHQDAKAEEVLDAFLEGGKVFEDTMRRSKTDRRRYSASEIGAKTAGLGQTQDQAKPTREQEWTAKYATAMLRGTSVKNVRVAFEGFSGQENAYYQDGEIVLNGNRLTTQRVINYILGHELTHPGADADADLVQSILDVGDSLLGSEVMSTRLSMTRERYIRSYMRNHGMSRTQAEAKVTLKLAKEETAADLMSELFETPGAMERMGRESTGAKVLRAARDALNRMLSKLTGKGSQSARNEAEMLLERLNRALRSQESRGTMEADSTRRNSIEDLTQEEKGALLEYKSSGSYKINAALRDGAVLSEEQKRMVEALDRALEKLPRHEGTVYRRLSFDLEGQEALDAFMAEHETGGVVRYSQFTSTSTDPEGYPVEGELTVTAIIEGQNGRDIDGFGSNFESEIVFPRNSRFWVERVGADTHGKHVIYMREVAENGAGQLNPQEQYGEMPEMQEVPQRDIYLRDIPEVDTGRSDGQRLPGLRAERAGQHGRETDSPDYRGRQDAGRAGGGGQVRGEYRTAREGTGRDGRGDLGVLERALIPSDVRAAAEQNDFPNLELREILDPAAFSDALERAKAANPNGGMVDSQSVEHLDETRARTFMREDGLAGVAVEADGNIVGVFKHPDFKQRKVVKDLLLTAIAQGGNHLDCYVTGGKHDLASKYTQMGFVPVAWLAFNREYAPDGWNYEAWGEPDVVMWVHSGETALEVAQRSGTYPFFSTEYIHSLPQFDDYDAAKELQAQKVKEITEARKTGRRYSISSAQSFEDQVSTALTEDVSENRDRALYIRDTPLALRDVGLGDLPMAITAKHIQDIHHAEDPSGQHPEWHGISKNTLNRLPDLLSRPILIMDSATTTGDIVVVVEAIDPKARPVVVSIHPNGTARVDGQRGPANFITSVYGKDGYTSWVDQAVQDGRVLYWHKNRSQNLSGTARVQFPAGLTGLASNTIIKRHAGYVKDNIPERRFSVSMDSEGREEDDQGTVLRGVYGKDVQREAGGSEAVDAGRTGEEYAGAEGSGSPDERGWSAAPASWARGYLVEQPSAESRLAAENARRYGADAFVVEDSAIKTRNRNAWAITSGGNVYISDSIPAELAEVVGFHEAVHAAKQRGDGKYRDFLERTDEFLNFESGRTEFVFRIIAESRFDGRELHRLTQKELETAYDELNALVWGFHKADPENARAQFGAMFRDYDGYIAALDEAMEVTDNGKLGREGGADYGDRGPERGLYRHSDRQGAHAGYRGEAAGDVHGAAQRGRERDGLLPGRGESADAGHVPVNENDDIRYSVSDEDINPDTGYRRGSIEDSFMRIVNAGDEQRALDMLQSMLERMAAFEATRAERSNPADAFLPKPELTDDLVAKNRAAIQSLIDKYGRMEQTKAAARRVNFPNQIDDDTKVRGVIRTAASAKATPEALVSEFERSILDGDAGYTYVPISDKSVLDKIKGRIEQRGFAAELREWRAAIDSNKSMTKEDIARGEQLYVEACANKDLETAQQLVAELAMIGTQYGQVIQAISMLHKLSPTGQLYYLQKTVEHMTREYDKLGKDINVLIDPELAKQLLEASTKEEIDAAIDRIIYGTDDIPGIASQLPVTIWDKWDAWRYLAMLGNPTTHIRNMLSNAVFTPVRMTKDLVGIALETMFIRDRGQRTKGFATKEAREFAKADALVMKDILRTGGKHNITDRIRDAKRIFKIMPLEWARTKNTAALETEDWWTMQGAYIRALSGFLSARGADLSTLQGEGETREGRRLLNEARAYAVREAQKATYRDMNTMASILNQFRRAKNPFVRFAFGGLLPFTKTPFNIVRRGVEYSPIGLVGTIRTAMKGGSSAEILDRLSASFTGTGLLVAGYFLAKAGLLIGGMGDDPEDEFQELQGIQPYSFQIGDRSYTIDWLAPTVLPLFVGAELHRMTNGEVEAEDAYEAMMTILEPVMALSMMSGLNDTLSAVRYEDQDEMIVAMLRNMVGSYFTQGVPTILGRVARTMDDSRRTSFVSADATPTESWLSRTFQSSVLGKIPVAAEGRMLYIDAWGRADTEENAGLRALENFLSPGYYNSIQTTAVDEELMRLAKATNSTAVFPKRAEKSFTVDGEAYAMTQEEYQKHLIERGQTSYQLVSNLISSPTYAGMSDKEKARAVEKCYDYAAQLAKLHTNNDYGVSPWVVKLEQMTGEGLDADDYFTAYAMSEEEDRNMKEIISSTDRYDGATAALLMAMDFNASDFTDPYAKGYEYKLTDGQRETYRGLFVERLSSELSYLMSDDWYLDASVEERLEMLDETWSDTLDEVKRDMADWLWDHGIESTEKE